MSQRPQRAAAVQAIKANAAALAPRRRSDSQTSNKTITSPHVKAEEYKHEGRISPARDVIMQRASQQDLRRLDMMKGSSGYTSSRDDASSSYNHNTSSAVYWPGQDGSSDMNTSAPHASSTTGYHQHPFWDEPVQEQHGLNYHDHVPVPGAFDLHYAYGTQGNSLGLKEDPGLNVGLKGDLDLRGSLRESMQRDSQSFDSTDGMALLESLPFTASCDAENDSYEDSTDSDLPPEKKKLSAAFRPRGRKKRNKCTPDQLRSLEAFFEKNRNPTGRVRLELSRKLRMPERSVQVWFQNRRAKVKTIERRGDTGSDSSRKKSCSVRPNEKEMYNPANIGGRSARAVDDQTPSVTAIPTSALCIGTWRRVSPLICFFSRRLQSLTWYLTSESIGFKLEIPWTSIGSAYFDGPFSPSVAERAEGVRVPLGHFVLDLERPPTFFMEVFRSAPAKNGSTEEPKVSWRQCEDFTEDHQAMTVSRHILNGPYEELRSAVQSLARCNDFLKRLIVFRDEERRALGEIPTGSGSTADNFGLVNNVGLRPADSFAASIDGPTTLAAADVYANTMHMQMQPTAISYSSGVHKGAAWHDFRNPLRAGEHAWEFDSPASVSTNLSEASLDSGQRHHLGYSPYGVATSIEASPRSGLGSSVDLGSLRIDTGGMSNFGSSVPIMGDGGFASSRVPMDGWDGRLSYEMAPPPQAEAQYSVGGQVSSHTMQAPGLEASLGVSQLESFDRGGGERQNYSNQAQINVQHHASSSFLGLPKVQDEQCSFYDSNQSTHNPSAADLSSLLPSRRVSHATAPAPASGEESRNCQDNEPEALGQSGWMASRHASDVQPVTTSIGPMSRVACFDEDAFCGKTPTHRTTFGNSLHLSQMTQLASDQAARSDSNQGSEWNGSERYACSSLASREDQQETEYENTTQGRARSNTYRPSAYDGRAAAAAAAAAAASASAGSTALPASSMQPSRTEDGRASGESDTSRREELETLTTDTSGVPRPPSGARARSPALLSLSFEDVTTKRDATPDPDASHTSNTMGQD